MSRQVQRRRGTQTGHGSFTGAVGEITVVTDQQEIRVHDNSTVGGWIFQSISRFVAQVHTWIGGQRKQIATRTNWSTAWTLAGGLDWRVTASSGASSNHVLPLPTDAGSYLADNTAEDIIMWLECAAGSGADFDASWAFQSGAAGKPDFSAGGKFQVFLRVQKGNVAGAGNLEYLVLGARGPFATA